MELDPTTEQYHQKVACLLAAAMLTLEVVDLQEVTSTPNFAGRHVWVTSFPITDREIDAAINVEPSDERIDLEFEFNRERLIGHWILVGIDTECGGVFHFPDIESAAGRFLEFEDALGERADAWR